MVSGSTSTAISRPPRRSETVSAAPIAPIIVKAGVPTSRLAATRPSALASSASMSPNSGLDHDERQRAGRPMGGAFDEDDDLQRRPGVDQQIERAVLLFALKQAIEAEQRGEQRGDPQDRRTDAREQVEVGTDRKRHDRDEDQEEHRAGRSAAADSPGDPPFPQKESGHRHSHRARFMAGSAPSRQASVPALPARAARGSPRRSGRRRRDGRA